MAEVDFSENFNEVDMPEEFAAFNKRVKEIKSLDASEIVQDEMIKFEEERILKLYYQYCMEQIDNNAAQTDLQRNTGLYQIVNEVLDISNSSEISRWDLERYLYASNKMLIINNLIKIKTEELANYGLILDYDCNHITQDLKNIQESILVENDKEEFLENDYTSFIQCLVILSNSLRVIVASEELMQVFFGRMFVSMSPESFEKEN